MGAPRGPGGPFLCNHCGLVHFGACRERKTMRIVIDFDSQDNGFTPTATLYDEDGNTVENVVIQVRDFGTGEEVDEVGNLYAWVT